MADTEYVSDIPGYKWSSILGSREANVKSLLAERRGGCRYVVAEHPSFQSPITHRRARGVVRFFVMEYRKELMDRDGFGA
jgi:hypothetical protein